MKKFFGFFKKGWNFKKKKTHVEVVWDTIELRHDYQLVVKEMDAADADNDDDDVLGSQTAA